MELNSKSFEEKDLDGQDDFEKIISPIAQKINETGVKQINKLEGLLTESVNKS